MVTSTPKTLKLFQALLLSGAASVNPGPASSMSWCIKKTTTNQTKTLQLPQVTAVNAGRKHTSE